jgi:hypothetical protein
MTKGMMVMRLFSVTAGLTAAVTVLAGVPAASADAAASADDISDTVSSIAPDPGELVGVVPSGDVLLAATAGAEFRLPIAAEGEVTVTGSAEEVDLLPGLDRDTLSPGARAMLESPSISLGLPEEVDGSVARVARSGDVVYEGPDGSVDVVVQPLVSGDVRIQSVSNGPDAPTAYAYDIGGGLLPTLQDDGSVSLTVETGDPSLTIEVGSIESPWAYDAEREPVHTHYEVVGSRVIQHVAHDREGVSYPVVADPVGSVGIGYSWHFNRAETKTWAGYGVSGIAGAGGACGAVGSLGGPIVGVVSGAMCGTFAGKMIHAAGVAENSSPKQCFYARMVTPTAVGFTASTYKDSRCK